MTILQQLAAVTKENFGYDDQVTLTQAANDETVGIVFAVIAGVVLLVALIFQKSIRIAIAVF